MFIEVQDILINTHVVAIAMITRLVDLRATDGCQIQLVDGSTINTLQTRNEILTMIQGEV